MSGDPGLTTDVADQLAVSAEHLNVVAMKLPPMLCSGRKAVKIGSFTQSLSST